MATRQKLELPFHPRPWQRPLVFDPAKRIVAVVHRRAGKSTALMWRGILRCLSEKKSLPRVVHILPYAVMWSRTGLWDALTEAARNIPGAEIRKASMSIAFANGAVFQCGGADNQDSWRGGYADEAILDEYDDTPPSMVPLVIEPMLADRDGTLVRSGTPKGRGLLQASYDRARTSPAYSRYLLDYRKTGALSEEAIARLRQEMSDEEFAQELECSFNSPNSGSYYGKMMQEAEDEGRICIVPHEPGLRVWTSWDLGIDDSTAIWFCQINRAGQWRFIDFIEGSGEALEYYVRLMQQRPYLYERHLLPHDAEVRELGSGRSRTETLHNLGVRPTRVVRQHSVADGIQAVRSVLPKAWFDAERCAIGIRALRNYRREWNENAQTWRSNPVHDFASHGCLTGDTLVHTDRGAQRIDQMRAGDRVWTPAGYADVEWAGEVKQVDRTIEIILADGRQIECTPEHKIATQRGFVRADTLRYLDTVLSGNEWESRLIGLYSKATSTGFRAIITDATDGVKPGQATFTELSGKVSTDLFQRAVKFITETATLSTMPRTTSNALMLQNINGSIPWSAMPQVSLGLQASLRTNEQPNGTPVQKDCNGIARTADELGIAESGIKQFANSVVRRLLRLSQGERSGAISTVRWKTYGSGEASLSVYDLTVRSHACYQANGFLVSNSDSMRYMALGVRDGERRGLIEMEWHDRTEPRFNAPPATAWMAG